MIRRPPRSTHCISSAASDVYKRQVMSTTRGANNYFPRIFKGRRECTGHLKTQGALSETLQPYLQVCLLYTSDAADDMQCVDLGGRRIIKKKKKKVQRPTHITKLFSISKKNYTKK
eukprot:TRINITY_DN9458_c0_g1_i2.p1 TRINITY_DN9458_c0_g1~~TRINITY_DN9458_c0_g1_i2.p1  ORF type:complete len:116 (+),score=24.81 TRINITY_DN9458_c0_g1_i2:143-490(+)